MKTLHLDPFSGVSGDMFLGLLLDLGVDFEALREGLACLRISGYHVHASRRTQAGITGTKLDVHLEPGLDHPHDSDHRHPHPHCHGPHPVHGHPHVPSVGPDHAHAHAFVPPPSLVPTGLPPADHPHHAAPHEERDFQTIAALVTRSALPTWVRDRALGVFRRLAEAEGKIHGQPPEQVHFHEVGAVDSIVDIVGGCLALDMLGRPRLCAAPLVEGRGWVQCAHGRFPVPTPATLEILSARGLTLSQCDEPQEMITPTGAALLAELVEEFGAMPPMQLERVGYGLGTRTMITRPNVLRGVLGEAAPGPSGAAGNRDWEIDQIACLETNLDDTCPEVLGHFIERALTTGALDVFCGPVQMKKSRPGVVLTVLCAASDADRFTEMMLVETSAFGIRRRVMERRKLRRECVSVDTPWGPVAVKVGRLNGRVVQNAPEYESCRTVAATAGVPVKTVYEAALRAFGPPSPVTA